MFWRRWCWYLLRRKTFIQDQKRGDVNEILKILVEHGATPQIKVDAHPHIGTNKLPKIIENIRETILNYGGEILFNSRLSDIILKNKVQNYFK